MFQFDLNNAINLRHLTQRIMSCYTHKMAIVYTLTIDSVTLLHPMYWIVSQAGLTVRGFCPICIQLMREAGDGIVSMETVLSVIEFLESCLHVRTHPTSSAVHGRCHSHH